MAEPFVFHFLPDDAGRPSVMYIADILAECSLCRFAGIQRFYHNTSFHSFTLAKLDEIASQIRQKAEFECENCGTPVGPDDVLKTTTTYGFPDEAGEVRIFRDEAEDSVEVRYVTGHRLDPQDLPGFDASVAAGKLSTVLNEESLELALGRVFNLKRAWSEFLDEYDESESGQWVQFSRDAWGLAANSLTELESMIDELESEDEFMGQEVEFFLLQESTPHGLATHEHPERIFGSWDQWIPERHRKRIDSEKLFVGAVVSWDAALTAIKRAFEVAQLRYEEEEEADDLYLRQITTPGDLAYKRDLSLDSVLRRAVFTGITPGEAGRLSAEEIVGTLLRVWTPMEKK